MKWLAHLIEYTLIIAFAVLYITFLHILPKDTNPWWSIPIAITYATFFVVTMHKILSLFPHKIRKYWAKELKQLL